MPSANARVVPTAQRMTPPPTTATTATTTTSGLGLHDGRLRRSLNRLEALIASGDHDAARRRLLELARGGLARSRHLNVVLASIADAASALALFRGAVALGVQPTVDSYNILAVSFMLEADAVGARRVLSEMAAVETPSVHAGALGPSLQASWRSLGCAVA